MKPHLLVIELHHLGDAVIAIPFLRAASERYEVKVFCTGSVAEMLATFVPEVRPHAAQKGWMARFRQAATELRETAYAASVCAWSDTRSHLIARLSGAPIRLGLPVNKRNYYATHLAWRRRRMWAGMAVEAVAQAIGWPLLTDRLERPSGTDSHLQNWLILAEEMALEPNLVPPWFSFEAPAMGKETADFIQSQKAQGKAIWVIHAGGRLPTKRWPVERYEALLKGHFAEREIPVLIIEAEEAPRPQGPLQRVVRSESHADLAAILQAGDILLANDSYAGHLAAAMGKTVYTIFGSGNPDWFAPFGQETRVIRSPICPYHPCIDRCLMPKIVCLDDVRAANVTEMLLGGESSF